MIAVRFSVLSFRIDLALLSSYLFSVKLEMVIVVSLVESGGFESPRRAGYRPAALPLSYDPHHFHALPLQLRKQLRGSFFRLYPGFSTVKL